MHFRPRLWPTVATVLALLVLLALGTWQVQRLGWKTELIAAREAALAAPPIELTSRTLPDALAFRRAEATGRFLHAHEFHLGPRVHDGHGGVHVLTPLRLADGALLLVNRGWVPTTARDAGTRPDGQLEGPQTVQGIVRVPTPPGRFTPDNEPEANQWFWIDPAAMADQLGEPLLPVVLAADATAMPGGLPVGGQGRTEIRNNHLQYAITWYALALVLVVIYVLFHRRPKEEGG